jgi:hypothetical protein
MSSPSRSGHAPCIGINAGIEQLYYAPTTTDCPSRPRRIAPRAVCGFVRPLKLSRPRIKGRFADLGATVFPGSPTDFGKFIVDGSAHSQVCGAALQPTVGRGWIDVARGVFYRRAEGERETKKRKPVPLPPELHDHIRRWKRRGQRFAVEPVRRAGQLRHRPLGGRGLPRDDRRNAHGPLWSHHPDYLSGARGAFSRHHGILLCSMSHQLVIKAVHLRLDMLTPTSAK